MEPQAYLTISLFVLLLLACGFDVHQRRIPNRLLAIGLASATLLHVMLGGPMALISTLAAGFGVGLLLFLPLYLAGTMAAGDVKLMATVGAFTGPLLAFQSVLASYCAGGLLALAIVLFKGRWRQASANLGALLRPIVMRLSGMPLVREPMPHASVGGMPYALAITAGTVCVLWIHHT